MPDVPDIFHFTIPQGQHFHWQLPAMVDAGTGLPFDFTADPAGTWTARFDLVNKDGFVLVQFATSGSPGVITLGSDGIPSLDLSAANTAALTPTEQIDGVRGACVYGDLVLVDPVDNEPWVHFKGVGKITRKVTA